jgi:DNA-binding NarL/FixJ family response regulator
MIRILLIEDNPADARFIYEMLKEENPRRYHLAHVDTLGEALMRLGTETFDVVLLDLGLPDSFGPQAVEPILSAAPGTPVVVLSGLQDDNFALQAAQIGAQDYVIKGRSGADQLVRSIRYAILRKRRLDRGVSR